MAKHNAVKSDDLYNADKAVRDFCKEHPNKLNEEEHETIGELLRNRAKAMSNALDVEIHSICN